MTIKLLRTINTLVYMVTLRDKYRMEHFSNMFAH